MGWNEVKVEEQRLNFINEYQEARISFADLCQIHGISRKTGYKWLARFYEKGKEGLRDLSRTPHTHAFEISREVIEKILEIKHKFPYLGPKKIHARLRQHEPNLQLPCINSIGNILDRHGLVIPRRYRRRVPATAPLAHCYEINHVWAYDFKGWFMTGDGKKCEPFTLTDGHTRYLLRCTSVKSKTTCDVWPIFESAFREYGLPFRVRSDNGPPFATTGAGRISSLSVLLIKAGVTPEWITPGKPQENGRHERMHLTLKNETASPPAESLNAQERLFRQFQHYYNNERPHEALNQQTPSSLYRASDRVWDGRLREPEYPDSYEKRKIGKSGLITWRGKELFLSETLYGEHAGIVEQPNGGFDVYYGPILLGHINLKNEFEKDKLIRRKANSAAVPAYGVK